MMIVLMVTAMLQGGPSIRGIEQGIQSLVEESRQVSAATPAEWQALWSAHAADRPQPSVDLARELVVAVFLGSRPTAGFGVEVVEATSAPDGALVVRYRERRPGRDTITAQVITSPFHIVAVPRPSGQPPTVRFERVTP